jgi:transcriptional regulator with XRE-family HTH domain
MNVKTKNSPLADLEKQFVHDFGVRVREHRKHADMSQMDLAHKLTSVTGRRYHQTTVGRIENGTRPTSAGELFVLAALLGIAPADLLPDTGDRRFIQMSAQIAIHTQEVADAEERLAEAKQRYAALTSRGELTNTVEVKK